MAEEQYPIFKSEGGAFDRAKVESDIATSGGASVTQETGDSMKEADKAYREASDFYTKIFKEEIKALDSAYDPNSIYYSYAYSPASSDKRQIQRSIEKGESVDGKEVVEIAKGSAANKVKNATALKTGSVTQIVETVGVKAVKDNMEGFEEVKSEFDSKIQNEDFKFEKLLGKFSEILSFFNDPQPLQQNLLYTPENNAVISALAKILSKEGFENESVKAMASKYDDNVDLLSKKSNVGIESVSETAKEKKEGEAAISSTSEQKIESKTEQKPQENNEKTGSTVLNTEQKIESVTESPVGSASQTETKAGDTSSVPGTPQSIESSTPLSNIESAPAITAEQQSQTGTKNEGEGQIIRGSESGASFLKDMFGGLLSSTETKGSKVKEGLTGLLDQMSSKKGSKPLTEAVSALESNTSASTTSTEISAVKGGQEKSSASGISKSLEKIQEKSKASPETLSKTEGIKETVTQKLSSPLQVETPPKEEQNTKPQGTGQEVTSTEVKTESMTSSEASEKVGESSNQASQTSSSAETKGDKGNEDLSKKMETMIALLSQLNDTLAGPLLVTSTTKKFE